MEPAFMEILNAAPQCPKATDEDGDRDCRPSNRQRPLCFARVHESFGMGWLAFVDFRKKYERAVIEMMEPIGLPVRQRPGPMADHSPLCASTAVAVTKSTAPHKRLIGVLNGLQLTEGENCSM